MRCAVVGDGTDRGVRIAVLGAGLTGTLVALELAEAGHGVHLFDRQAQPFSGASLACEGKIHLGYVYALDRSRRTAETMLRGAAAFRPLVERWTGAGLFAHHLSGPFLYAVPNDSLLPVDAIRAHFAAVAAAMDDLPGPFRPSPADGAWRALAQAELAQTFDPGRIAAVFETAERAIDTAALAADLRDALAAATRITLRMGCHITAVSPADRGFRVAGRCAGADFAEGFDIVVNALWEHRIQIDATLGLPVDRAVVHRFKYGVFTRRPGIIARIPNVTFLIGSYGDSVAFGENAYLSWYPVGLVSQEVALRPRVQDLSPSPEAARRIITGTLDNLAALMPGVAPVLAPDDGDWTIRGGFVTAWGKSGIEDVGSELHARHDVGVFSTGDYHSVDTGKLTLAPLFAAETCARILARHGVAG